MDAQVRTKFISKTSSGRAQMISSARNYVKNDQFLNLLQNVELNDVNIKNKNKTTSIYWISAQLAVFNGLPELCA